jgi:hypothetical protein
VDGDILVHARPTMAEGGFHKHQPPSPCQCEPKQIALILGKVCKSKSMGKEESHTISAKSHSVHGLSVMSSSLNRRDDFTGRHIAGKPFGTGHVRTLVVAIMNWKSPGTACNRLFQRLKKCWRIRGDTAAGQFNNCEIQTFSYLSEYFV